MKFHKFIIGSLGGLLVLGNILGIWLFFWFSVFLIGDLNWSPLLAYPLTIAPSVIGISMI